MKFRRKPIVLEAFKFGVDEMPDWFVSEVCAERVKLYRMPITPKDDIDCGELYCDIRTLEGTMRAYEGKHYIIKGIEGEVHPCRIDIFEKTYEVVN